MVISISFLQLGQIALSSGNCWVTVATLRTHGCIDHIEGGLSTILTRFLNDVMFGVQGLNTAGVPLRLGERITLLFARVTNVLADGDGLRQGYSWRGAAGLKPCVKHFNIFKKVSLALFHTRRAALMWQRCRLWNDAAHRIRGWLNTATAITT